MLGLHRHTRAGDLQTAAAIYTARAARMDAAGRKVTALRHRATARRLLGEA